MLIALRNTVMHYDLLGEPGAPVVCLVHALGADTGLWVEQVPALLAAGYRVLRLDLRGHGTSSAPEQDFHMTDLADDVADCIAALGLGKVHYVGLSLGGMCGQAVAIHRPEVLHSLITCDALPKSLVNAAEVWGPRMARVRAAGSVAPIADATMERWLSAGFRAANPARWQQIRDTVAQTSPAGYAGCAAAISNFDFLPDLPGVRLPVLVACGEHDEAVPPAEGRRIASLIPGARFELIADALHLPNVEQAAVFNAMLLGWLSALR